MGLRLSIARMVANAQTAKEPQFRPFWRAGAIFRLFLAVESAETEIEPGTALRGRYAAQSDTTGVRGSWAHSSAKTATVAVLRLASTAPRCAGGRR